MKVIDHFGAVQDCPFEEELQVLRHTAAHVLAQAVTRLYPHARLAFGPATEKGFYYDFDLGDTTLSPDVLPAIETEMRKIVQENLPVRPSILSKEAAAALLTQQPYKLEHLQALPADAVISIYQQGEFLDLCIGPHLCYTKALKAFGLTQVSGAYWKNDKDNKMLTRIHGVAFRSKAELDAWCIQQEEAEKRDHRRIGKEMELFLFRDEGPGFPFFLPKGMVLKNTLTDYWRQLHRQNGYQEISTPMLLNRSLWETSGHWAHYQQNMYATQIDGEDFCVKPMNCPGSVLVYASQPRSYRDLPLRLAELGVVHRHELRGALHGLFRVRCFTQDDAHIFLRRDQITEEITKVVQLIRQVYEEFGFDYFVELSTRPSDSMGSDEDWTTATKGLQTALEALGLPYHINPGDGAFYGPKIDFHLRDSLGRTWQCGTIQLDFQLPQNFGLEYIDETGGKQQPILLHRVCFGSLERFLGILTEHYAGKFPFWLAPVQAKVLPVSEKSLAYAKTVHQQLLSKGIRSELDERNEKIGYKIRQARQLDRVPYMLILGENEAQKQIISVRSRETDQTESMTLGAFLTLLS